MIYNTFSREVKDFPCSGWGCCAICRTQVRTSKKTISNLKKGQVDIIVGTHRILSKDVQFKDLGLLVVDEEQRFGVAHKEKIKQLKTNVDVLTLTATPNLTDTSMSLVIEIRM